MTAKDTEMYDILLECRNGSVEIFSIDFDQLWKWIGYSRKDAAKRKLLGSFVEKVDWTKTDIFMNVHGGHNKGQILLTPVAAQRFALQSGIGKSDEIANFFIKIVELFQDYRIIYNEIKPKHDIARNTHNHLLINFRGKHIVYLVYVGNVKNKIIYKFGKTENIDQRMGSHFRTFGFDILLVHAIECEDSKLELRIKRDENIKKQIRCMEIGGENRTELLEFDDKLTVDKYIKRIEQFQTELVAQSKFAFKRMDKLNDKKIQLQKAAISLETEKRRAEHEKTKQKFLELEIAKLSIQPPPYDQNLNHSLHEETLSQEDEQNETEDSAEQNEINNCSSEGEIHITIPSSGMEYEIKTRMNSRGYKIQRIAETPDGFVLKAVYSGEIHASRVFKNSAASPIKKAIENCSIYKGYRWFKILPGQDETIIQPDMPPTNKDVRQPKIGLVAKLDKHATVIKSVFPDQISAAREAQLSSKSAMSNAIKNGTPSHGHIYKMYNDCSEELRQAWLANNTLPDREVKGIRIERMKSFNGCVEEQYDSIQNVIKNFQISRTTFKNIVDKNIPCRGWYFRYKK
ncbi:hypothetical protein BDK51DRAFT_27879 [Blyttiomyces helicus]|uniref:MSV199 domain-containing protein n=1 Tax=Blyttiomyces helicus TaxID=388810 RepID=A0A4P9WM71_9FUNG|nr:hypothetical protein BDK51DRAFT_27879 [Blyttiomyces helicus]|eukprot:RKO93305.1 hypothetical protein BDK51DRAFT_27879 [Blyttiomyces helicus]